MFQSPAKGATIPYRSSPSNTPSCICNSSSTSSLSSSSAGSASSADTSVTSKSTSSNSVAAAAAVAVSPSPHQHCNQPHQHDATSLQYSIRNQQPLMIQMPSNVAIQSVQQTVCPAPSAVETVKVAAPAPAGTVPMLQTIPQAAAQNYSVSPNCIPSMATLMSAPSGTVTANGHSNVTPNPVAAQNNNNSVYYSPLQVHTGEDAMHAAAMYAAAQTAQAAAASQQQVIYMPSTPDHTSSYLYNPTAGTLQPDPFQMTSDNLIMPPSAKDSLASPSSTSSSCGSNYSAMMFQPSQLQPTAYQTAAFYSPPAATTPTANCAEVRFQSGEPTKDKTKPSTHTYPLLTFVLLCHNIPLNPLHPINTLFTTLCQPSILLTRCVI